MQLSVDVRGGQKTGMFLDHANRRLLGSFCKGARMLDVYSYAGGFALQALRGGAASATCVDISPRALTLAQENAQRNHLGPLETVESDAFPIPRGRCATSTTWSPLTRPSLPARKKTCPPH